MSQGMWLEVLWFLRSGEDKMGESLHNVHNYQNVRVNIQETLDWIINNYIYQFRDQSD